MVSEKQKVMSSKNRILQATAENQPTLTQLPFIDFDSLIQYPDPVAAFEMVLKKIGGEIIHFKNEEEILKSISKADQDGEFVLNTFRQQEGSLAPFKNASAVELAHLNRVYLCGALGVAENGAIWLDENAMVNRLLPFITQHLVLILNAKNIVATMNHAYQNIRVDESGFGTFIAGPSKTADIEQSLVIGAHGPRSLTVYLFHN